MFSAEPCVCAESLLQELLLNRTSAQGSVRPEAKQAERAANWRLLIMMVLHFAGTNVQILSKNFGCENWQK